MRGLISPLTLLAELAEQVLAVVNPDAWLVRINGIQEPYCERLRHASGDLSPVQPSYFGGLRGRLRGTETGRQRKTRDTTPRCIFL